MNAEELVESALDTGPLAPETERRSLRDLVALSTLPAMWHGADPLRIGESLAAALYTTLGPSVVYVGFLGRNDIPPVSIAQTDRRRTDSLAADVLGAPLLEWCRSHDPQDELLIEALPGSGELSVITRPLGLEAEFGVIAAGFPRDRKVDSSDLLLLNVAATQAATAIQNAYLLRSLQRSEERFRSLSEELAEHTRVMRTIEEVAAAVTSELNLSKAVQAITDAATGLTEAEFGAFFYNVVDETGDKYMLYTLSGAQPSDFADFPMPRATALFGATFRGEPPIRVADVLADPRYGQSPPFRGMPPGHLPVRSYLAVPVRAPGGEVLGGLFFGHSQPGVFSERHEELTVGLAQWGGIAIDNARLYQQTTSTAEVVRQSEERYRDIFESSPVSLWEEDFSLTLEKLRVMESQGVTELEPFLEEHPPVLDELIQSVSVIDVNQEAIDLFEAKDKAQLKESLNFIFVPESRQVFIQELVALSQGARSFAGECVLQTLQGRRLDTLFTLAFPANGNADRVLVSVVDITERKRAEEEIKAASVLKDQFLGLVSHELRTPIATVKGNALILLRRGSSLTSERREQALLDIASEGERLQRVIENLLMLTRIDASHDIAPARLSLRQLLSEEVAAFEHSKPERQVIIEAQEGDDCILANDALIRIVLNNLLSNADKYSQSESPIVVHLLSQKPEALRVKVTDSGIGIPAEDVSNLFTPFFRTASAQAHAGGMGLGLAVCKRIVEAHGGSIWAERRLEGGSIFTFELPCASKGRPT